MTSALVALTIIGLAVFAWVLEPLLRAALAARRDATPAEERAAAERMEAAEEAAVLTGATSRAAHEGEAS